MSGQRVAYVRVSSHDQNPARQLEVVGECDRIFVEKQSGKSTSNRPELANLIQYVRAGDLVVVASMDRLARSVIDLNNIVQQITGDPAEHSESAPRKGASIEFLKERLTFTPGHVDPMATFQLNMMGAFAQFERELIRQRQAEGIAAAKKRGVYMGRPPALSADKREQLLAEVAEGKPKSQVAREYGISRATLYRILEARDKD